MQPITITQGNTVLAHHTTAHPRSSYGQSIWSIEVPAPATGPATWRQGGESHELVIIGPHDGWLVCRQADGRLCGIIWSDGSYYANLLVTKAGRPVKTYRPGLQVRGSIRFPDTELGAIL